jgi:hypothetical protein
MGVFERGSHRTHVEAADRHREVLKGFLARHGGL